MTKVKPGQEESQVDLRRRRPGVTPYAWRAKAKLQPQSTKVEMGAWQTRAEPVGLRTMAEPEGRRGPVEPEGWRIEAQPETPEVRGKVKESIDQGGARGTSKPSRA